MLSSKPCHPSYVSWPFKRWLFWGPHPCGIQVRSPFHWRVQSLILGVNKNIPWWRPLKGFFQQFVSSMVLSRWWQLKYFLCSTLLGVSGSNLTHIFQMGWNHHLVLFTLGQRKPVGITHHHSIGCLYHLYAICKVALHDFCMPTPLFFRGFPGVHIYTNPTDPMYDIYIYIYLYGVEMAT